MEGILSPVKRYFERKKCYPLKEKKGAFCHD